MFRDIWPSNKENPSVYWHATLSCPSWPQITQICISFRSRSDLVLDADHALAILSDLAFQACISFYSILGKSGAWMFLPCSIKNAVAHRCIYIYTHILAGLKKALPQNPPEMIRGRIFSEMIRIQARKSELQAESRSYDPKVGDTAGQTPRIWTESPREGPRMGYFGRVFVYL